MKTFIVISLEYLRKAYKGQRCSESTCEDTGDSFRQAWGTTFHAKQLLSPVPGPPGPWHETAGAQSTSPELRELSWGCCICVQSAISMRLYF